MVHKITWSSILPYCFKPQSLPLKPKNQVSNPNSNQRLALSDISDPGSPLNDLSNSLVGSNLHIFTLSELKTITHEFSSSNYLGEGGFGPVYKGFVDATTRPGLEAQPVAVKLLDLNGNQGHREWLAEVVFLGQLRHPHLVKLIGYCCEDEHRLLVYEYMARGNLEKALFRKYSVPLPWLTRIKISVGAAKGLAFLHAEEKPVIYRDFKGSNILLETDYTAKLSDFGLAKDGPEGDHTHVTTRPMGTPGYTAPEYIMTGHLTKMSDVYSFGVLLLELLTGRPAMDRNRPSREKNLVEWGRPLLKDPNRIEQLMDPRLEGLYSIEGAKKMALLAYQCLSHHAKSRPTMDQVINILQPLLDSDDISVGSFVYIAPQKTEEGKKENDEPKSSKKAEKKESSRDCDEEKKENLKKQQQIGVGQRHKHRLRSARSGAVYSDTALYQTTGMDYK